MKNKFQKIIAAVLFTATILLSLGMYAYAGADKTISESIDIANINENLRGAGYEWQNIEDTLVLNGIRLVTEDTFGIHLHSGVTIKISGDNYISAKDHALLCRGAITFEGNGTLTLVSGDTAIQINSTSNETVRFRSGNYEIKGSDYGIYSDTATVALAGANIKIEGNKAAIKAKNVNMSSGSIAATGAVNASENLTVISTDVTAVSTSGPALCGTKKTEIKAKRITAGETLNGLIEIEKYGTEKAVKITASSTKGTRSTLFGEKYPAFLDYLAFVFLILMIAALIGVPLFIKHKKTQKLIALSEEMNKQKNPTKNKVKKSQKR